MAIGLTRRDFGVAAAVAGLAAIPARAETAADHVASVLPGLLDALRAGMEAWHIPGVAVGVVAGGRVLLAEGLGVRRAGGADPVDAGTVFQIGSATKAFCAATEAMLVDAGKLGWMDRVIDHEPEFRLFDPWVTREFRIIDLLAQRSGLRPYVLDTLIPLGFSVQQALEALRHVEPVGSFRADFSYQNLTHQVAGRIVARLSGAADWGEAAQRMIFGPLGMQSSSTTLAGFAAGSNTAVGHVWYDGRKIPLPASERFYRLGPAGTINSNIDDMTKWLRLQLGRGVFDGKRLVSAAALEATWIPRVYIADPKGGFPWISTAYGNGWVIRQTEHGTAIWHNGGTSAFKAHVGFIPALDVGLVILTNEGTNLMADATGYWFYDEMLGNAPRDYAGEMLPVAATSAKAAFAAGRPPAPVLPPGPAADYAGSYESPILGTVKVSGAGDGALDVAFVRAGSAARLLPWSGDTFALMPDEAAMAAMTAASDPFLVQFTRDPHLRVTRMVVGEERLEADRAAG